MAAIAAARHSASAAQLTSAYPKVTAVAGWPRSDEPSRCSIPLAIVAGSPAGRCTRRWLRRIAAAARGRSRARPRGECRTMTISAAATAQHTLVSRPRTAAAGLPDATAPAATMTAKATVETTPAISRARLTVAVSAPSARKCR